MTTWPARIRQKVLLSEVRRRGPISFRQLAVHLKGYGWTRGQGYRSVIRAENAGLIERTNDATDGSRCRFRLTE